MPVAQAGSVMPWGVHVGSWKDLPDAEAYAEKVRAKGLVAEVCRVEIPERGVWYRVLSGSFASAHEAAEARPAVLETLHLQQAALYRLDNPVAEARVLASAP